MYWKNPSYALQIEIASYALMTFALKNEQDTGMKVLDWLVQRRGSRGGFSSTQVFLDFSLTVKAATLIFISGRGSAISSAKEGKSGFIYNLIIS